MDFEFGETQESRKFFERNPLFFPTFERLMTLTNQCFGRPVPFGNRAETICFELGHACRSDYLEILFLVVNGFGRAASKLLRGQYERAVALAYIAKHPEKAERFVRYGVIQEKKAMDRALEIVTEDQFNEAFEASSASELRKLFEEVKAEFQVTDCRKCKTQRMAISWDVDVASMVRDVGATYLGHFVTCYTLPTLHLHATAASVLRLRDPEKRAALNIQEGDFAALNATAILLLAIRCHDALFELGLNQQIESCSEDLVRLLEHYKRVQRT